MAHQGSALHGFLLHQATRSISTSPLDGMLEHRRVITSVKFASTNLYIWAKIDTVRVECLAKEHNTMSPTRA